MRKILIPSMLLAFFNATSFAQNVGIGTTTPRAYGHGGSNRFLEIRNSGTGTDVQAHLILSSGGSSGSLGTLTWANTGIPTTPDEDGNVPEQRTGLIANIIEGGSAIDLNTGLGFFTRHNRSLLQALRISASGNVGIGITQPTATLHVQGSFRLANGSQGVGKVLTSDANGVASWTTPAAASSFWTASGANIYNNNAGNVGIGTSNPNAPLQFGNSIQNRKLVLYQVSNNDNQYHGFGINGSMLRYQSDATGSDHAFFAAIDANSSRELMRIKGSGNVGIGTATPQPFGHGGNNRILEVLNNTSTDVNVQSHLILSSTGTSGLTGGLSWANYQLLGEQRTAYIANFLETNTTSGNAALIFYTRGSGSLNERLRIASSGNVGIGTGNPTRPLSFPPTLEKKISLYPGNTGDAGFGVFGNQLRIHSDNANADISLGFDDYTNGFTERMRVKGNGNVGIGNNDPTYKLDISGRLRIRSDGNTAGIWLNNSTNDQLRGFIGMFDQDQLGLYGGAGGGWGLTMSTSTGAVQANNSLSVSGFTRLGESAPAIKTKLITGTTSVLPAGFADIPHGLDKSKIIGISILVTTIDGVDVGPGYFPTTGLWYQFQLNATNVRIVNPILPIDCALILLRPVRILLTYQE
jgi:hypothetical protein